LLPKNATDEAMPADPVAVAAVWGVARMTDRRAMPMLRAITKKGTPEMRALGVLGLGQLKDKASVADIAAVARSTDSGNVARAAAAYALGDLGAEAETPTLLAMAQGPEALPRELAIVALARMGAAKSADPPGGKAALVAMADALFAGGDAESSRARQNAEALQRAGAAALVLLATPALVRAAVDVLPVPDGTLDVEASLDRLVPRGFAEKDRAAALLKYTELVQKAAQLALETSGDRARSVLEALDTGDGALRPFVTADPSPISAAAQAKARDLARALEPSVVPLAKHPNAALRTRAVVFLAHGTSPDAQSAVVRALDDGDEGVQRVALAAIGARADAASVVAVSKLLATHRNWAMRVLAAQALGRLGATGASADASAALARAAEADGYALVREAALEALATFDAKTAIVAARQAAEKDPEPRVRDTARRIVGSGK
jgi:HEAT repeat protein